MTDLRPFLIFIAFFIFIGAFLVTGIISYIFNLIFSVFNIVAANTPSNTTINNYSNTITQSQLNWDNSIVVGYIIFLVVICLISYAKPNLYVGVFELVSIFAFAFIYVTAHPIISNVANAFNANTLMPTTSGAWYGGYILYLTIGALVASCGLNMRNPEGEG